nr:PREDICTED: uncharacterized protein LOC109033044 [Bemisia tabaci]
MSEYLLLLFFSTLGLVAPQRSLTRDGSYSKQSPELTESTQQQTGNEIQRILETLRLSRELSEEGRQADDWRQESGLDYPAESSGNYGGGMSAVPSLFNQRLMMTLRSMPKDDSALGTGKRGKYMSLCHFKICNMGRKRWKAWP